MKLQLTVPIEPTTLDRLNKLTDRLTKRQGVRVSRSRVSEGALERGLALLEIGAETVGAFDEEQSE